MNRIGNHAKLGIAGIAPILLGVGFVSMLGTPAFNPYEEFPGDGDVYQRIDDETDCATLLSEADAAMERFFEEPDDSEAQEVEVSYADRAMGRFEILGCRSLIPIGKNPRPIPDQSDRSFSSLPIARDATLADS